MNNQQITYIQIDKLEHHPKNPRKDLGDLTELIDSIKQKGILQNLTVVPWFPVDEENYQKWKSATKDERDKITDECGYFVLIGNRRFEAAKSAGLTELPCIIGDIPREEQMEIMLLENMQRSDLTVYEEAQGFQMMLDLGYSADEIAEKTGFGRSTVYKRVNLLKLDQTGFKASVDRGATISDLVKLDKIENEDDRNAVLNKAGTQDFDYALERALKKQENRKYIESVVACVKPVAKELTEDEKRTRCNYGSDTRNLEQIAYWNTWKMDSTIVLPDLKEDEEYFYYVDEEYSVTLYGPIEQEEENEEPDEVAIKREARNKVKDQLEDIWSSICKIRINYILGLSDKHWANCIKDVVKEIILSSEGDGWIDYDDFTKALNCPTIYDEDTESDIADINAGIEKMLETGTNRTIGLFLVSSHTELLSSDNRNVPFSRYTYVGSGSCYREDDEDVKFETNILEKIGYEPSEEEKQVLDGSHELYKIWEENNDN